MSGDAKVLIEHLFRRQAGRIVAHLARLLGPARLDLAEECFQESMLRALETWPFQGVPENPAAWLFRVARNAAIDALRRGRKMDPDGEAVIASLGGLAPPQEQEEQLRDDELRMIFMCCHPELGRKASVALSLKIVGGFSVREIARAFLASPETIAQRLVRAKRLIRERRLTLQLPGGDELTARLEAVLDVLYLLFNEGYAAAEGDDLIRQDLCLEALRMARLLASPPGAAPKAHALAAMMALQAARLASRTDSTGDLILLEDQDRALWDEGLLALGFDHFARSMAGDVVTRYHVQAAIAATHARASHGGSTDWPMILELYEQLLQVNRSAVVMLNRAVAVWRVHGAAAAMNAIADLGGDPKMAGYHHFHAVRGHLLAALGDRAAAAAAFRAALGCRASEPERRLLRRRLAECEVDSKE